MSKPFTDNSANAHTSPNRMVETITPMPAVRLEPLDTLYYLWIVTHQKRELILPLPATQYDYPFLPGRNGIIPMLEWTPLSDIG